MTLFISPWGSKGYILSDQGKQESMLISKFAKKIKYSKKLLKIRLVKQHKVAYYAKKQHFFKFVWENLSDFYYFHQIKNNLELSRGKESLQVPFLVSSKQHYRPKRYKVILKAVISDKNSRTSFIRSNLNPKNRKLNNQEDRIQAKETISEETLNHKFKDRNSIILNAFVSQNHIDEKMSVRQMYLKEKISQIIYRESYRKVIKMEKDVTQFKRKGTKLQEKFSHFFEGGKDYTNNYASQKKKKVNLQSFRFFQRMKRSQVQLVQKIGKVQIKKVDNLAKQKKNRQKNNQ